MEVFKGLEPKKVFEFFEEITRIPHGSKNTRQLSDHIKKFATDRSLKVIQEPCGNLIIYKPGTKGYERSKPVCLQGHMDMVCEKTSDSRHNFKKDPLPIAVMDDEVFSRNTTLGADDGIAVAMCMAILDSDDIPHPPLEVILTVDEEIGLDGAKVLNYASIKSRSVINLDTEDEGVLTVSSAGGLRGAIELPVTYKEHKGCEYDIVISGLKGGHSGDMIDKYNGNAIMLLGRLFVYLSSRMKFRIVELSGGLMDNAIPREAGCHILVSKENASIFEDTVAGFEEIIKNEFMANEDNIMIYCEDLGETSKKTLRTEYTKKIIYLLAAVPNGVINMCQEEEQKGFVKTSLNFGITRLDDDKFLLEASLRSSVSTEKYALSDRLRLIAEMAGAKYYEKSDYPAWEYCKDSEMRKIYVDLYTKQNGHKPVIKGIHAGLECGIIYHALKPVDIISFGPDIKDAHTPKETLSISSTARTYELLCGMLGEMK